MTQHEWRQLLSRTAGLAARSCRRPAVRRLLVAGLVVVLAAVGSVAGVVTKQRSTPPMQRAASEVAADHGHTAGTARTTVPVATSATSAPVAAPSPTPTSAVVAPMKQRVDPDLLITSPVSLTPAQVRALVRSTGAVRALQVDYAQVKLGPGITTALGVDPSTFRDLTPDNTAPVDALWQRVKSGDVAVAHAVAAALQVKLGGWTTLGRESQVMVRIGAFATSRLPGVGVVVDRSRSAELGLVRGAALIMVLPSDGDPIVAQTVAQKLVPKGKAQALRYAAQSGLTSTGSSGPTVPGGVPILGDGWTLPLRSGSFTLTQRFGGASDHPGIDLGAPWGTPIYAAAEGDVLYWGPAQGFGNWIVLQHPGGVQTVYGHMRYDELLVKPNAHVSAGQLIARVGSEGDSTGPHLHFEVHVDNVRVDPIAFLGARGVPGLS